MKLIIENLSDPFLKEEIYQKAKKLLEENQENILNIVKESLREDFIEKEIHLNLISQYGSIVYGFTKEREDKVYVSIEVPEEEIKHILNVLGWELVFALAKNKAYQTFFEKFKDYVIAEILADQIGVLVEKEIIFKVGNKDYNPSTVLDHSSPRNPSLYKLQKILIENWQKVKEYSSLSAWLDDILKNFPSEIEREELQFAYLSKKLDILTRTLIQILKEIRISRKKS